MFIPTNKAYVIIRMPHKSFREITGYFRKIGKYRWISMPVGKIFPIEDVEFPSLVGIIAHIPEYLDGKKREE